MSLLADEGVDYPIVEHLRDEQYDVRSILEEEPGISDEDVLSRAVAEDRLVLTSDKDFGEMVFRQNYPVSGVILLRLAGLKPKEKAQLVTDVIDERTEELRGHFTVVGPEKIRMRAMNE